MCCVNLISKNPCSYFRVLYVTDNSVALTSNKNVIKTILLKADYIFQMLIFRKLFVYYAYLCGVQDDITSDFLLQYECDRPHRREFWENAMWSGSGNSRLWSMKPITWRHRQSSCISRGCRLTIRRAAFRTQISELRISLFDLFRHLYIYTDNLNNK